MGRLSLACMLLGCGLVLDLDPSDPDGGAKVDSAADVRRPEDTPQVDVPIPTDAFEPRDAGSPDDIPTVVDAVVVDIGGPDAGAADAGCNNNGECRERPCQIGVCVMGDCNYRPRENGTPCSDERFCTVGNMCNDGVCGIQRACPGSTECDRVVCDDVEDACVSNPQDGMECNLPNAAGRCVGVECTVVACAPLYGDCDARPGCETNVTMDPAHCGGCGLLCDGVCRERECMN